MSAKGGITKGKSHKEGGIPMEVKSTGQKVELEGGEGVINKKNMADTELHEFEGKKMTKCEIASEINKDGGNGVEIDCNGVTGKKYEYGEGGEIPKGYTKELETEDFIYYVDEFGEQVLMIRKSDGSVASDNYFAENDLFERMTEIANGRESYIYLRPESKKYLSEFKDSYEDGGETRGGTAWDLDNEIHRLQEIYMSEYDSDEAKATKEAQELNNRIKELQEDYIYSYAEGGWVVGGKKKLVFADGSAFIVERTKDKQGIDKPILIKTTQQESVTSILLEEKSLAQKSLDQAKEKNIDFPTLLVRLKKGNVFKKFYDTYAEGGKINSKVNALKKGDIISIEFGDSIRKDNKVTLKVRSRNKVRKGTIDKITFENANKPNTIKYYAYERGNGVWGFAKGDMAISNVKIVDSYAEGGGVGGKIKPHYDVTAYEYRHDLLYGDSKKFANENDAIDWGKKQFQSRKDDVGKVEIHRIRPNNAGGIMIDKVFQIDNSYPLGKRVVFNPFAKGGQTYDDGGEIIEIEKINEIKKKYPNLRPIWLKWIVNYIFP